MKRIEKITQENWETMDQLHLLVLLKLDEIIDALNEKVSEDKEWEPEEGQTYFFIDCDGLINDLNFFKDENTYDEIKSFMGVFRTREEAEWKLLAIKNAIKDL